MKAPSYDKTFTTDLAGEGKQARLFGFHCRRQCCRRKRSADKREALLNFSFSLEGNASKRQRVYKGKNDNAAPLLSYAGPTLADLEVLCRTSTAYILIALGDTTTL